MSGKSFRCVRGAIGSPVGPHVRGALPDSLRLLFDLLEAFDQCGVRRLVTEYFGERPALSHVKLAHRRLTADATGGGITTRRYTE
jgi:hypothetical protein